MKLFVEVWFNDRILFVTELNSDRIWVETALYLLKKKFEMDGFRIVVCDPLEGVDYESIEKYFRMDREGKKA